MAISFSRPDPSSPAAVGSAAFQVARRGFDQGEVRDFLRMVAAELARLQEREKFLESELRAMQTRGMSAPGRLDEETVISLLGEEAARVLSTAREASTQIRDRAEEAATRLVKDAAEDAARMREAAMNEVARIREDAAADANGEIEMAKQQGRDMVNEAREYREKVLSELSRRRDAARAQIEQLLHGRDRLLSAFERARVATDAVLGELTDAHDEPEFIVDLSPTTGPVPVVNPAHPSVSPVVTVFDQHAEDAASRAPATPAATVVTVEPPAEQDEHPVVIVDIEAEPVADEIVVVTVAEQQDDVEQQDDPVVDVPPVVDAEVPVDEPIAPRQEADETDPSSNVVSLFGRRQAREVAIPVIEDHVEEGTTTVDMPIDAMKEPDHPVRAVPNEHKIDDIFLRLRAASTKDVAEKAGDSNPTPRPSKKKAPAATVQPHRFEERDEVISPVVSSVSRRLKRVLVDEQNGVLEHLRAKRSALDIDAILGTAHDQCKRYADAIADDVMAAAGAGVKAVKSHGGSARRVTDKKVLDEVASLITSGLVASFREDARIAIGEAEGDRDIMAGLLRDVYRSWKSERIDAFVDDIILRAYGAAAYAALEPGTWVMWMTSPGGCCSECEDNSLAGTLRVGEAFPAGHHHSPAHMGCRCLVWPVRN